MKLLSKNLKTLLKKTATSQAQLESVVNKRQSTLSNWLNGKSEPDATDLLALSHFFHISIDDLCCMDLSEGNLLDENYLSKFRSFGNLKGNLTGNLNDEIYHFSDMRPAPLPPANGQDEPYLWAIFQQLKAMSEKLDAFKEKLDRMQLPGDSSKD